MKSGNGGKVPNNSKSSPAKEKLSPASPMDDIEKGNLYPVYIVKEQGLSADPDRAKHFSKMN